MPALVAGIHVLVAYLIKDVDGRDKPGHDVESASITSTAGISGVAERLSNRPGHGPGWQLPACRIAPERAAFRSRARRLCRLAREVCRQRQRAAIAKAPLGRYHRAVAMRRAEAYAGEPRHDLAPADGQKLAHQGQAFARLGLFALVPVEHSGTEGRERQRIGGLVAELRVGL